MVIDLALGKWTPKSESRGSGRKMLRWACLAESEVTCHSRTSIRSTDLLLEHRLYGARPVTRACEVKLMPRTRTASVGVEAGERRAGRGEDIVRKANRPAEQA